MKARSICATLFNIRYIDLRRLPKLKSPRAGEQDGWVAHRPAYYDLQEMSIDAGRAQALLPPPPLLMPFKEILWCGNFSIGGAGVGQTHKSSVDAPAVCSFASGSCVAVAAAASGGVLNGSRVYSATAGEDLRSPAMAMKEQRRLVSSASLESVDRRPPVHCPGVVPCAVGRCSDTDTRTPLAATFQLWPPSPPPPLPPTLDIPPQHPPTPPPTPMPPPTPSTPPAAQIGLPAPTTPTEASAGPSSWTLVAESPPQCNGDAVRAAAGGEAAAWDGWWRELAASPLPLGSLDGLDPCGVREEEEGWLIA